MVWVVDEVLALTWRVLDLGLMKSNMEKEGSSYTNSSNTISSRLQQSLDETRTTKLPAKELDTLNCPRCNSKNTKFCYYNNYSLTQPRYFCKTCRRYWTGKSLRDAPIGGGSRKNKKSTTVSPASTSISVSDMISSCNTTTATSKISDDGSNHDLINSAFSLVQPLDFTNTTGITTPSMPIIMNYVPSLSFAMQESRTNAFSCPLNFIRGIGHGENSEGRLLFPFKPRRVDYTDGDVNGNDDQALSPAAE